MITINFQEINLSKEYILNKVDSEDILSYYLGFRIPFNRHIISPIREENHPSFSFIRRRSGDITWMDWTSKETGDCFSLLQKLYNINFYDCLKMIYEDFIKIKSTTVSIEQKSLKSKENSQKQVILEFQPFTGIDIEYWKQFNISLDLLTKFNVKSLKRLKLTKDDKTHEFYYSYNNPMYYYGFGENFKVYRPLSPKRGKWFFFGKSSDIEGYDQLPWIKELLVITKSLKDVMTLNSLGYSAISLQGEGNKLDFKIYQKLNKRFKTIVSFYDNDKQGIIGANLLKDSYDIKHIFIPKKYSVKDISEFCSNYGVDSTKNWIKFLPKLIRNDNRKNRNT